MREEHRTVTVLFADLAGSTKLAELLEGEDVKLLVGEAIGLVVAEVERLGGYVKDLAGDGVLAFFGAPVSYEDDAERAARAALNIVQTITAFGSDVARGWGVEDFGVRVGISTGSVALGNIGSGTRVEYAAFGDTVNTAARLQSSADVGTALVDASTKRWIDRLFVWGEPRTLSLKGKTRPVPAFPLQGVRGERQRLRGAGLVSPDVVGRDHEMATIRRALREVRAGAGGMVVITGEAGLGKSRLLIEAHDAAGAQDKDDPRLLWLEGRCLSYAETLPYFPFRNLLRDWLGLNEGEHEIRIRIALRRIVDEHFGASSVEVYPYLASLLGLTVEGDGEPGPELSAERLQGRTFAAVGMLLERLARDRPVVIALEDLHWADASSLQLVGALLPVVERSAVLFMVTQRDERDHASWGLKEAATRDFPHLVHRIELEPLPPEAERGFLQELIGPGTLTVELERRLLAAAGGNPFFLEELVRSLVDAAALTHTSESGWRLDHDVPIAIPETVEKVILARADRLPPDCHEALMAASVVGRAFDLRLLGDLVDAGLSLPDSLHELQRLGFVVMDRRWPQPRYRFKHVLIQEALYRTILGAERTRLHRTIAESLEQDEEGSHEDVLALARHWFAAGVPDKAASYYRRGAELALRVFANEEAIEALTAALDLLGDMPESRERNEAELELRTILGVPLVALGGYGAPSVADDYARARDLCIGLGRSLSPPILRGLATSSLVQLRLADATQYGTDLLASAEAAQDEMLIVEGRYVLGVTSFWMGDFEESRQQLEEAIARYDPARSEAHIALYSQDPKVVCLSRLAWCLWFLGYPEQAAAARDASISLADELGHPFSRCYANAFAAMTSHFLGDDIRGDGFAAAAEAEARQQNYDYWKIVGGVLRSWTSARGGDRHAIEAMSDGVEELLDSGQLVFTTYLRSLIARASLVRGEPTAGLETVEEAWLDTQRTGALYLESELARLRGQALRDAGAPVVDVIAAFSLARDVARRQQARSLELGAMVQLTNLCADRGTAGDKAARRRALTDVYDWFTEGHETRDLVAARRAIERLS
jgi:class 3 adenylate cyclase/tetratricopeptide (TPR) repeat protein